MFWQLQKDDIVYHIEKEDNVYTIVTFNGLIFNIEDRIEIKMSTEKALDYIIKHYDLKGRGFISPKEEKAEKGFKG